MAIPLKPLFSSLNCPKICFTECLFLPIPVTPYSDLNTICYPGMKFGGLVTFLSHFSAR